LSAAVETIGGKVRGKSDGALIVTGVEAPAIGEAAAADQIVLHELSPQRASLEEAFMELTREEVEFQTTGATHESATTATWTREAAS
jgi:ABC-2 type transport system ATP-binding protein